MNLKTSGTSRQLMPLMLSATFTGIILTHFETSLMASPLITTIVDALSLLIYLQVASAVLGL